jgi:hypothetical protein
MPVTFELSHRSAPASSLIGRGLPGSSALSACIWAGARSNSEATSKNRLRWLIMIRCSRPQASMAGVCERGAGRAVMLTSIVIAL